MRNAYPIVFLAAAAVAASLSAQSPGGPISIIDTKSLEVQSRPDGVTYSPVQRQ